MTICNRSRPQIVPGAFVAWLLLRESFPQEPVGGLQYSPDFAHVNQLPPSEVLISLHTTEKQWLVAHDIYLIINKLVLKVCEVGTMACVA